MMSLAYHRLLDVLGGLAAVLVFLVMMGISVDVFTRYITGRSITWMFEVSEYALLYIPCLGMAWLARENGHIAITTFVEKCGPRARRGLLLSTTAACALVCGLVAYWGAVVLIDRIARNAISIQAIEVPDYLIYWVIPFGFGLAAIEFLLQLWRGPYEQNKAEDNGIGGDNGLV